MKKIMIAMGAVMSLALGAWADGSAVVSGGTVVSYMPFTGMPTGSLDPTEADNATDMVGSGVHWECAGSTEDSVITNQPGYAYGEYLQIDQTETLYRLMNVTQASTTNEVTATEGIYFASKVQFTASDETNGVNLVSRGEGDKLLIWLRAADFDDNGEVDGTNLVVTAAGSNGPGDDPVDYVINNVNVQPGTWYTLVVKSTLVSNGNGLEFTIELDGTPLVAEGNVTSFYSLVGNGSAAATITKVGFKGTGAVDDLEFGTIALEQETFFKVGNKEYATFDAALLAASSGDVIKLLKNYAGGELNIGVDDEIILDLAGHTISLSANAEYGVIHNVGTLTITNSTAEVGCVNGGSDYYAVYNENTLTIVGGKYYGMDGSTDPDYAAVIDASENQTMTVYYISNGTANPSVLEQVATGDDAGYWVIQEAGSSKTEVTAYLSLNPVEATYDATKQTPADYTTVTVVFSNATEQVDTLNLGTDYTITWSADTVTNANSDYVCTVTAAGTDYTFETVTATLTMFQYVLTWDVTFSTNETTVCTTNVVDGQPLTADKIPAFTGGKWDVDPTNAVITCATNFNYTISGSNWPEEWNDNNEPVSMKTAFDKWIAVPGNNPAAENAEAAFLSGVNVADYTDDFAVATIAIVNGKVQLTGNYDLSKVNGAILLLTGDTPSTITTTNTVNKSTTIEITPAEGETKKFYKLVLGYPAN